MKTIGAMALGTLAAFAAQAEVTNLITNGGFEESNTPMAPAGHMYLDNSTAPTGWTVGATAGGVVWLNAVGSGNAWNPYQHYVFEGTYTLGFQRGGYAEQTVTTPADGYYELTWEQAKRMGSPDHTVVVKIDGRQICAATSVWEYWARKPFTTGAVWLTAGTHTVGLYGVDANVDATSFVDGLALTAVEVEDVTVAEGTQEIDRPLPTGKLTVAKDAAVTVAESTHGIRGVYRKLDYCGGNWPFTMYAGYVYSLTVFQKWTHFDKTPVATKFLGAADGAVFSVGDDYEGTLPDECKEGGTCGDGWAAEWYAVLTIPESGLYTFRATVDDAFLMALDRRSVFQSQDCTATETSIHLEKGPHACYIGLLDDSSKANLKLEVKGPGDADFKGLPLAWFTPMEGPNGLSGEGDVAPADGTALVVAQSPYDAAFTGRLAGDGTGALVLDEKANGSTGRLDVSDVTGGVPYLANGELAVTADGRDLESVGSAYNDGTLSLVGVHSVTNLYGGQKTVLGKPLYVEKNISDATCGISTGKAYTHLKSFPLSGVAQPTVNGVTFDGRGEMDGTGPSASFPGSGWTTGLKSLFNTFNYGNGEAWDATYTFVLKGLTPGQAYDYRFYFLRWGVGPGGNGRWCTFTFEGQDFAGHDVTFGSSTFDANAAVGDVDNESMGIFGCRYVAGKDGQLKVTVASANPSDTVHCYAFSNEKVDDVNTVTLAPAAGTRASLLAELAGTDSVVVDGAGEQLFGGAVTLPKPLAVRGKAILTKGADVRSGVDLDADATLEVRGGAKLAMLSGTGTVDFRWGDRHPFGALQDDGTFTNAPNFRTEHFTCDADSGVSPTKTYLAAFNYVQAVSKDVVVHDLVNEVGFKRVAQYVDNEKDFRAGYVKMTGSPQSMHSGNLEQIGLDPSQGFYTLFSTLGYASGTKGQDKYFIASGLSAGQTYEIRFYERLWDTKSADTRRVQFKFWADEKEEISEEHEVYIDREALTGPYYIAVRFTAQSSRYTVVYNSLTEDTWHLYAASLEKVEDAANRRILDFADDTAFAGTVTGCGFVQKQGAGKLTLSGAVNAPGFWYVHEGAVFLDKAASTLGTVAVGSQGAFGGAGRVADDLGVYAGATLVLGDAEKGGALAVGGTLAVGEGAKIVYNGMEGVSANAVKLPKDLTVQAGKDGIDKVVLFTSAAPLEGVDLTGWKFLRADGSVDKQMKATLGADGKSVRASRGGLCIFVR